MRLFGEPIGSWIATAITNDPDARPALDAAQCVRDDHAARRKRQAGILKPGRACQAGHEQDEVGGKFAAFGDDLVRLET